MSVVHGEGSWFRWPRAAAFLPQSPFFNAVDTRLWALFLPQLWFPSPPHRAQQKKPRKPAVLGLHGLIGAHTVAKTRVPDSISELFTIFGESELQLRSPLNQYRICRKQSTAFLSNWIFDIRSECATCRGRDAPREWQHWGSCMVGSRGLCLDRVIGMGERARISGEPHKRIGIWT